MINRLRKAWRLVAAYLAAGRRWCAASFDRDDVFTLVGLALVASGVAMWSLALALIITGALLLWVFLPARPPFFDRPGPSARVARRPPV